MKSTYRCVVGLIGCSVLLGVGCSVINSYDDVLPSSAIVGGSGGASQAGAGGNLEGGSAGNIGSGGNAGAGNRPRPTRGLIVIGGTELDQQKGVLSVLDAANGRELNREELVGGAHIAGIAYDGAANRDVWFVFFATDFPAKTDKVVDLQVRYFDDVAQKWQTLAKVTTLPPPEPGTFAVLNDRLAYLSHKVEAGKVVPSLTILDTSNLDNIKPLTFEPTPVNGEMIGLLGTRGTATDPTGLGGVLNVAVKQDCDLDGVCSLFVQPVPVGDTATAALGHVIGNKFNANNSKPAFTSSKVQRLNYYAIPALGDGNVKIFRIEPSAPESAQAITAPTAAQALTSLIRAECQNVALLTTKLEESLFGVTLSVGVGKTLPLGHPGQIVDYEPFSGDVITSYNPEGNIGLGGAGGAGGSSAVIGIGGAAGAATAGAAGMGGAAGAAPQGPALTAVHVLSPTGTSLTLNRRAQENWQPPENLRVNAMVTRFPVPFECK